MVARACGLDDFPYIAFPPVVFTHARTEAAPSAADEQIASALVPATVVASAPEIELTEPAPQAPAARTRPPAAVTEPAPQPAPRAHRFPRLEELEHAVGGGGNSAVTGTTRSRSRPVARLALAAAKKE